MGLGFPSVLPASSPVGIESLSGIDPTGSGGESCVGTEPFKLPPSNHSLSIEPTESGMQQSGIELIESGDEAVWNVELSAGDLTELKDVDGG